MKFRKGSRWIALGIAVLLLLSGCTSINGVDMNQVTANVMSLKSYEGEGSAAFTFVFNPKVQPDKPIEAVFMKLLSGAKLEISSMKRKDLDTISYEGSLVLSKGTLPFTVVDTKTAMTIRVEGAKKPIVYKKQTAETGFSLDVASIQNLILKDKATLAAVTPLLAQKTPNLSKLSVSMVELPIHGAPVKLAKVHIETDGKEIANALKTAVGAIVKDSAALGELVSVLFDSLVPVLEESLKDQGGLVTALLKDKQKAVTLLTPMVKSELEGMVKDLDKGKLGGAGEPGSTSIMGGSLNAKSKLSLDLYLETPTLTIRKMDWNVTLVNGDSAAALQQMKMSYSAELWNVNQPVTPAAIDVSGGITALGPDSQPGALAKAFDSKSLIYEVLKNDLKAFVKRIVLKIEPNRTGKAGTGYIKQGVTMVPLRFVTEQLEAQAVYDKKTKSVTITSADTKIVLTLGSKTAVVNGKKEALIAAPEMASGVTYVPVSFIVKAMGGTSSYDAKAKTVLIIKE